MKVIQINQNDIHGGAARAAYRLHNSLQKIFVDSSMLVRDKASDDETVHIANPEFSLRVFNKLKKEITGKRWAGFSASDQYSHSTANISGDMLTALQKMPHDLVNLHWLGSDTLTIEEIGRINKPIVWTVHDMWAFCGAEHYTPDGSDARFRVGYWNNNRPEGETGRDLNRWVWERKRKAWRKPMTIVCPSNWLADCARDSFLFRGWQIHCIPNTLDVQRWRPLNKEYSREFLGLPKDGQIVLFGAVGGEMDQRKGGILLHKTLYRLHQRGVHNIHLVIFGQSAPKLPAAFSFPVTYLGRLYDDVSMVAAYSAANVMLVPSRQDNLPQTAVEAQACGTPVAAFNIGGLPDIVMHRKTGWLAKAFDTTDLAEGIVWLLEDKTRYAAVATAARQQAEERFSEPVVATQYANLYRGVLERSLKQ